MLPGSEIGVVQQERVALVAGRLHVAVIGDEAGHEADAQPVGQNVFRPVVIAGPGGIVAVDADRDGRQSGRAQ